MGILDAYTFFGRTSFRCSRIGDVVPYWSLARAHARPLDFDNMSPFMWTVLHLANVGMTLFFVLSGIVIHLNYADVVTSKPGIYKFFVARFSRLYPLFIVAFILGIVHLAISTGVPSFTAIPLYLSFTATWWYFPTNGVAAASVYQEPGLGVMWSLSTEAFFYCMSPIILPLVRSPNARILGVKAALIWLLTILVALAAIFKAQQILDFLHPLLPGVQIGPFEHWLAFNSPWIRIFEFLFGAFCAELILMGKRLTPVQADLLAAASIWLLLAMFCYMYISHSPVGAVDTTLIAPAFGAFAFAAASPGSKTARLLGSRFLVWGGEASYSLYILHSWILVNLSKPSFGIYNMNKPWLWVGTTIFCAIAISRFSYVILERPAQRMLRQMMTKRANA